MWLRTRCEDRKSASLLRLVSRWIWPPFGILDQAPQIVTVVPVGPHWRLSWTSLAISHPLVVF